MEKRIEHQLLSRGNTGSSLETDLGVLVLAFPQLKPTASSWSRRRVLGSACPHLKPTATTWSGREGDEYARLRRQRAVTAAIFLRDACLGGARETQAPVPWLMGAASGACTLIAEFPPGLRETALEARIPFAELGPCPRGTSLEAHIPVVERVTWPRETTLKRWFPPPVPRCDSQKHTA